MSYRLYTKEKKRRMKSFDVYPSVHPAAEQRCSPSRPLFGFGLNYEIWTIVVSVGPDTAKIETGLAALPRHCFCLYCRLAVASRYYFFYPRSRFDTLFFILALLFHIRCVYFYWPRVRKLACITGRQQTNWTPAALLEVGYKDNDDGGTWPEF